MQQRDGQFVGPLAVIEKHDGGMSRGTEHVEQPCECLEAAVLAVLFWPEDLVHARGED